MTSSIAPRPLGAREIVRVLAFGQQRKAKTFSRLEMRQSQVRGAIRCLLSRAVAVKTKDRLVRHLPQQHELVFGERRTERRNGCGKACGDHRDDVDIAFDHDQRRSVMRGLTRGGEVVEIVALVKQRGFRRVEIFRGDVFLQRTAAEGDDASAHIRDRKHHAIAKTIIGHGNIVAGDQEARFHHVFYRNALRAEMLLQGKSLAGPARGIADAELQLRRRRNRAVAEIAARLGAVARGQRVGEEFRR